MKNVFFTLFLSFANLTYTQETESDVKYNQEVKSLLAYIQLNFIGETNFNVLSLANLIKIENCKSTYESSIFNSIELEYIRYNINNPKINYWTNEFFPSSNIIENEIIEEIFKDEIKNGWEKFEKKYGSGSIVSFSSPIFLRNYTIAIIKFSISSGYLSGDGYEALLIKKGNSWEMNACSWGS